MIVAGSLFFSAPSVLNSKQSLAPQSFRHIQITSYPDIQITKIQVAAGPSH
jgi:hypothetical protein